LLVFVLAAFCWTKSLMCNVVAFTGMQLNPESTLQLWSSRRFCEVFKEVYFSSLSAFRTTWYSIRTLISQQHPFGR
jgi:glycerol uptake facilitator-like aquaporin